MKLRPVCHRRCNCSNINYVYSALCNSFYYVCMKAFGGSPGVVSCDSFMYISFFKKSSKSSAYEVHRCIVKFVLCLAAAKIVLTKHCLFKYRHILYAKHQ